MRRGSVPNGLGVQRRSIDSSDVPRDRPQLSEPRARARALAAGRLEDEISHEATGPFRIRLTPTRATAFVISAAMMSGLVPVFVRSLTDDGMAAVAVAFYRNILGAVLLLGFIDLRPAKRSAVLWGLGAGAGMGLGWTGYVRAIEVVPVSTAGVVYMSYPLLTVIIVWVVFRQRPAKRAVAGGLVILVAAVIALGPEVGNRDSSAVLLVAFAAPLSFGFAIAVLTERLGPLAPFERVATVAVGSTLGLAPLMFTLSWEQAVPADARGWSLVLGISAVTAIVPQYVYVASAPHVGPARAAAAGAVELPMVFAIGFFALGEALTWPQAVAGLLVVIAIAAVPSRPSPGVALVRRRHRLVPGRFWST